MLHDTQLIGYIHYLGLSLQLCFSVCLYILGGNALILKLWGKKNSGPPLFSLHFGFGLGGLLAPQIARPFISDVIQDADDSLYNKDQNISVINYENYSICSNDSMCISRNATNNPLIIYPFIISGGVFVATALPFFLFQAIDCVSPATDEEYIEEDEDDEEKAKLCSVASCASEHTCFGIIMLLLLFLYYMQVVGGEHVYGKWIYSFALETDTGFTKDQATLLVSLFWFCHMSGRGIGMILSKFIHITYIIIGDIAGLMVSSIALSIWGHKVPMVLWVFTAAMGLLVSPMFPAGLLWANLHMRINPITLTICMMGGSAGHLVYVYMGGFFLEYFGTERVMLTEVIYAVTIAVIFILMHITTRLHYRMMDNSLAVAKEIVYVSSEELEMIQDEGRSDSREMVYVPKSFRA